MDLYGYMLLAVPVSHRVRAALMARCARSITGSVASNLEVEVILSCGSYASMKGT